MVYPRAKVFRKLRSTTPTDGVGLVCAGAVPFRWRGGTAQGPSRRYMAVRGFHAVAPHVSAQVARADDTGIAFARARRSTDTASAVHLRARICI